MTPVWSYMVSINIGFPAVFVVAKHTVWQWECIPLGINRVHQENVSKTYVQHWLDPVLLAGYLLTFCFKEGDFILAVWWWAHVFFFLFLFRSSKRQVGVSNRRDALKSAWLSPTCCLVCGMVGCVAVCVMLCQLCTERANAQCWHTTALVKLQKGCRLSSHFPPWQDDTSQWLKQHSQQMVWCVYLCFSWQCTTQTCNNFQLLQLYNADKYGE